MNIQKMDYAQDVKKYQKYKTTLKKEQKMEIIYGTSNQNGECQGTVAKTMGKLGGLKL